MTFRPTILGVCFAFAAIPSGLSAQSSPSDAEITAFLAADSDQNQVLNADEFTAFVRLMARQGQSTARTIRFWGAYRYAFAIADTNNDGALTPAELANGNRRHMSGS